MSEKNDINCTCISPFFNPADKMFLLPRHKPQETDLASIPSRLTKTVELKSNS
jgi:hypothetical protein